MGMIWRHTPPPPCTALLMHGHNLRSVEGKEGASVPHRLHTVKELHHAKHVLNATDREHTCDHPGSIHHSSKSSIKKDIPLPVAFKVLTPSFQAATDLLPFETVGGPCVLNLFLWKLMPNPTYQNSWKNKWSVDTIGYVDTTGYQRQKGCPCEPMCSQNGDGGRGAFFPKDDGDVGTESDLGLSDCYWECNISTDISSKKFVETSPPYWRLGLL